MHRFSGNFAATLFFFSFVASSTNSFEAAYGIQLTLVLKVCESLANIFFRPWTHCGPELVFKQTGDEQEEYRARVNMLVIDCLCLSVDAGRVCVTHKERGRDGPG